MQTLTSTEFLSLPYLTLDSSLCFTSINKVARDLFGKGAVIGKPADFFIVNQVEEEVNKQTNSKCLNFENEKLKEKNKYVKRILRELVDASKVNTGEIWGSVAVLEHWTVGCEVSNSLRRKLSRSEVIVTCQIEEIDQSVSPSTPVPLSTPPSDYLTQYSFNFDDAPCSFTILFVKSLKPLSIISPKTYIPKIDVRYFLPDGATPPIEIEDPMLSHVILEEGDSSSLPLDQDVPVVLATRADLTQSDSPALEEARYYKDLIDYLPQIAFTADSAGRLTYFNNQWHIYTGLSAEESADVAKLAEVFWPDDMKVSINLWFDAVRMNKEFEAEYRLRGSDSVWRWCVAKGRPIKKEGAPTVYIVTITPVDQLIQARSDALRIQGLIAAVLNGAGVTLLSIDTSCVITFCEGSALTASGLGTAKNDNPPVGQLLGAIWPDPKVNEAVLRIINEKLDVLTWQTSADEAINEQYFQYRLVPLREADSHSVNPVDPNQITGVIVVAGDISQVVESKKRLEQSESEKALLIASECAAKEFSRIKTEFVTNISHEIRTPIAVMIGIFEILLSDLSLSKSQRELIEKSLRSGENLLDLVGKVLDMGKILETGRKLQLEKYPFLLADVLEDASVFSVSTIHKGLKFISDIGPYYTGVLEGDRVRIRQVLANVLSNSIKFTKNGSITLAVKQISESETQCVFEFTIRDTGIGIQANVMPTLFVPFQQADTSTAREYGGTGLGLAISQNLVELMGGTLELESIATLGTTMKIVIPVEKSNLTVPEFIGSSPASLITPLSDVEYASLEGAKILVAEDNELILDIVTRILRKKKFNVTGVCDGLEAVKAVKEGDFDLVLMDGQMPKLDGYAAAGAIRLLDDPKKRNIKIIALTASAFKGDMERCLDAGMDGYLSKPVRAKDLEATIWQHLNSIPMRD